jgi:hypothetical protein
VYLEWKLGVNYRRQPTVCATLRLAYEQHLLKGGTPPYVKHHGYHLASHLTSYHAISAKALQ